MGSNYSTISDSGVIWLCGLSVLAVDVAVSAWRCRGWVGSVFVPELKQLDMFGRLHSTIVFPSSVEALKRLMFGLPLRGWRGFDCSACLTYALYNSCPFATDTGVMDSILSRY